ncbi:SRPBCC family protein [Nocardia sp. NPDC058633]|uniref:SRPBCC family protein n=1 Tax=Nocardia sp. NPDC058633 TaxID=3346568 RepID=UPI003651A29E
MTWTGSHTLTTTASAEAIWYRWTTPQTWPVDDPDCRWARIDGPVVVGATGTLKAKGPASRFTFTEVEPNRRMVFDIALPLATLRLPHTMRATPDGVTLTHAVEITGPLAGLWGALIGRGVVKGLAAVVANVATNALAHPTDERR